jgi:iron complex transport system substrate-binding protein
MKSKKFLLALLFLFLNWNAIALAKQNTNAQRIVSLSPSITEILFAIGAGDQVAAVTDYCTYPNEALKKPKVGGMLNSSAEAIIALKPDLMIFQPGKSNVKQLAKKLDIEYMEASFQDLKSIYQSIQDIGIAIGKGKEAKKLISDIKSKLESYQIRLKNVKPKSTLLILGDSQDPLRDLYAVGKNTFLDELLTLSGGENVLDATLSEYPKISREFIISRSPEAVIIAGPNSEITEKEFSSNLNAWRVLGSVRAVQNRNIHIVSADYILIPGPRLVNIVEKFYQALHSSHLQSSNPQ